MDKPLRGSVRPVNTKQSRTETVAAVHRILRNKYRDFSHFNKPNVLSNLVFVICSVRATEAVYRRAYARVRLAYKTNSALASATVPKLTALLKEAGRQRQKAKAIRSAVQLAIKTFGKPSFEGLSKYSDAECEQLLVQIPWVGLKVARCVMMIPLGRNVFPVDTHVWRISNRLGWVKDRTSRAFCTNTQMNKLQQRIPPVMRRSLHVNMISLGREFCLSARPRCGECPLLALCPTGAQVTRNT